MFGFHPDLDRWTEIGNSGMFRPEMLRPMGLPDGVQVIAGGLSLERPTMIKFVPFAIYLFIAFALADEQSVAQLCNQNAAYYLYLIPDNHC